MRSLFPIYITLILLSTPLWGQESLFDIAKRYHKEGKDSLSLEMFTTLYKAHSKDSLGARALFERGKLLLEMGDSSRALLDLNRVAESPYTRFSFKAIEILTELSPERKNRASLLYRLSLNNENREERLRGYKLALKGFLSSKNYAGAEKALRWLIVEEPDFRESLQVSLAKVLIKRGQVKSAKRILLRYPNNQRAIEAFVELALEEGDTPTAVVKLIELKRPSPLLLDLYLRWNQLDLVDSLLESMPSSEDFPFFRAYVALSKGDTAKVLELLPKIEDRFRRALIELRLGKYSDVLQLVQGDTSSKANLIRAKAYLKLGRWLKCQEALLRSPRNREADSLRLLLSKELFRHGLFKEALEVVDSISVFTPMDDVYKLKLALFKKLGLDREADSLSRWLSSWGVYTTPMFNAEDLVPVLNRFYQGASPEDVAEELFKMGAYEETVRLLSSSKSLSMRGRRILADAKTRLFLTRKDTTIAKEADSLFLTLPTLPGGYYMLHRYWHPEKARLLSSVSSLTDDASILSYAVCLASQGKLKEAKSLALSLARDMRNDALFEIFLKSGELDSAFSYLDMNSPKNVVELGIAFYESGRYEASTRLLQFLPKSGFRKEERARFVQVKSLSNLAKWDEVEEVGEDFLRRFPWSKGRREIAAIVVRAMVRRGHPRRALYTLLRERPLGYEELVALVGRELSGASLGLFETKGDLSRWMSAVNTGRWDELDGIPLPKDPQIIKDSWKKMVTSGKDSLALGLVDRAFNEGVFGDWEHLFYKRLTEALLDTTGGPENYINGIPKEKRGDFYYQYGILSYRRGNKRASRAAFFKAFGIANTDLRGKVAFKLATILFGERRYEEAQDYYKLALELIDDPKEKKNALHNLAVVYKKRNMADSALAIYRALIDSFPESEEALDAKLSLAFELLNRGKFEEALGFLTTIRGEMPSKSGEAERTYWEGQCYLSLGNFDKAIRDFSILGSVYNDVGQWGITGKLELAKAYEMKGQIERAKTIYLEIIQTRGEGDPFSKLAKEALAKLNAKKGNR